MTWSYRIFWSATVAACMTLVACGQKKEENNGRPPGSSTGVGAGATSTGPISVDGKSVVVTLKDVHSQNGPTLQGTGTQVTFTIGLDSKEKILNVTLKDETPVVAYSASGDYVVTYSAKCVSNSSNVITGACDTFYLVAWISNIKKGVNESMFGLIKSLTGTKIEGDSDQHFVTTQTIMSAEEMIQILDNDIASAAFY